MMDTDRTVHKIFRHRFAEATSALCEEVKEILKDNAILHEHKQTSNQTLSSFARFVKSKIMMKSYKNDCVLLSKSQSAKLFHQLIFREGTYLNAKPQAFQFHRDKSPEIFRSWSDRIEVRKSRTGFYQALLGKHPMHFMKQRMCPYCGTSHDSVDILDHALFDCPNWQSERQTWIDRLEHEFSINNLPNAGTNSKLINILKQSMKPESERDCRRQSIKLVAFGGHNALNLNGSFMVTRAEFARLKVSDILSLHTAQLLHCVHIKHLKNSQNE